MDVSIIIVNYNTCSLLKNCIESIILNTKDVLYEIIVVDNDSKDDSLRMVHSNFPKVKLLESKENLGFGRANNKGAEIATGRYLFLLNTDTLLIDNPVKVLFDFMEKKSSTNIGACGGNLYKKNFSPNFSYSLHFPSLLNVFCYRGRIPFFINNENFNYSGKIKDVAIIIGADLFIRKCIFDELNGFDPAFFMYVEDAELSFRINRMNYRVVSNPEAKIIHLQGASSQKFFKLKMEIISYAIYFKKHKSLVTVKIYKLIELIFALSKFVVFLLTFQKKKCLDYINIIKFILCSNQL